MSDSCTAFDRNSLCLKIRKLSVKNYVTTYLSKL